MALSFPNLPEDPQALQDPQQEMSQEEMKGNLSAMLDKVSSQQRELNANNFVGDNQVEASRQDVLKQALSMMMEAGVDVNDPASIAKFMQELGQSNPDMLTLFEKAFESLLTGETEPEQQAEPLFESEDMGTPPAEDMGTPPAQDMGTPPQF